MFLSIFPEVPIPTMAPGYNEFKIGDNLMQFHFVIPVAFLNVLCYCIAFNSPYISLKFPEDVSFLPDIN